MGQSGLGNLGQFGLGNHGGGGQGSGGVRLIELIELVMAGDDMCRIRTDIARNRKGGFGCDAFIVLSLARGKPCDQHGDGNGYDSSNP